MGSFNKIGGISSLPISVYDKTVLIFLKENQGYGSDKNGGVCYPNDLYTPMFMPVFGEYDDYGRIENIVEDKVTKYICQFFGYDDIEKLVHDIDDIAVGRHGSKEMVAPRNNDIFQKMTFMLEHKAVYDKLVSECEFKISNNPHFSELTKFLESRDGCYLAGTEFPDSSFARIMSSKYNTPYENPTEKFIEEVGEENVIKMLSFNNGVSQINAKYFPSNYGSQDIDDVLFYKLASTYRNIIIEKIRKRYDDPGDILAQLSKEVRDEKLTDLLKTNA